MLVVPSVLLYNLIHGGIALGIGNVEVPCMHCRLSLAAMLDHPEYLTAEAVPLEPLSQGELFRQGPSPNQCLVPILARAAQAAWAAVQVRIRAPCPLAVSGKAVISLPVFDMFGPETFRGLSIYHIGSLHTTSASSPLHFEMHIVCPFVVCGRRTACGGVQDCQQNSRRLGLLSALLSAIFQRNLFSSSWECGNTADTRCGLCSGAVSPESYA